MWQFGGDVNLLRSNRVAGVVCDQNFMYEDFPTIIRERGLNGFEKPVQKKDDKNASPTTDQENPIHSVNSEFDNTPDSWASEAVEFSLSNGILYGDENGNYKLHDKCTRQEMLTFLYRLYNIIK